MQLFKHKFVVNAILLPITLMHKFGLFANGIAKMESVGLCVTCCFVKYEITSINILTELNDKYK